MQPCTRDLNTFVNEQAGRPAWALIPLFFVRHAAAGRGFLRRKGGPSLIIYCKNSGNSGGPFAKSRSRQISGGSRRPVGGGRSDLFLSCRIRRAGGLRGEFETAMAPAALWSCGTRSGRIASPAEDASSETAGSFRRLRPAHLAKLCLARAARLRSLPCPLYSGHDDRRWWYKWDDERLERRYTEKRRLHPLVRDRQAWTALGSNRKSSPGCATALI